MTPASGKAARAGAAERFPLGKILVADSDPELLCAIEAALRAEGHEVVTATTGWEALRVARDQLPWLLILDATMPDVSGYEICRRLRSDWRFADRGIMLLTYESLPKHRSFGLAAGADDFVLKPLDLVELADRVRLTQRRLAELRSSSPLTGLPGNVFIQRELERRVAAGGLVALLYVDLDHFKAYNDHYGFLRGDEAIRALAGVLQRSLEGRTDAFLGHVGGDDFVVLVRPDEAERTAEEIISGFERIVSDLYEPEDAARGWFEVVDRRGNKRRQGLLTISIGVATNVGRAIGDHRRLVDLASEMKEFAKSRPGNYVAVDRRSQRDLGLLGRSAGPWSTSPDRDALVDEATWADRRPSGLVRTTSPFRPARSSGTPRRRPRRGLVKYAAAALVALGLVGGPATVVLAENARPGEVLWSVRLLIEDARLVLEGDEEKDMVLRLEFAARRVGDLQYVTAGGGPMTLVEKVTENLAEHTDAAMLTYLRLTADRADLPALRSQMQGVLGQSVDVLQALVATACQGEGDRHGPPAAACPGLQRALKNSTEAMDVVHAAPGSRGESGEATPGQGQKKEPPANGNEQERPAQGQDKGPATGAKDQPSGAKDQPNGGKDQQPPAQGTDKEPPTKGQGKGKGPPAQGQGQGKGPPAQGQGQGKGPPAQGIPPAPATDAQPPAPGSSGSGKGSSGKGSSGR
jgi:diguanylate cyclase (GGDEF)-like protein